MKTFTEKSLVKISSYLSSSPQDITLSGNNLQLPEIISIAKRTPNVEFTQNKTILERIENCYTHMMSDVKSGIPIYGTNTGFGGQAGHIVANGTPEERLNLARKVSDGVVHVDVSVGPHLPKGVIRAAMAIRINMLMKGVSAVRLSDLDIYRQMLNKNITPIVSQYGGIGASGDLAHNCRVSSAARYLPGTKVWDDQNIICEASEALAKAGIKKLEMEPKAGLGLMNGDNFSTSLALLLTQETLDLLLLSTVVGAMVIEVLKGSNRSFHPLLTQVRAHPGQIEASEIYRYLLNDSQMIYQEMKGHQKRPEGVKVQDGYSLRCISQFQAVDIERIKQVLETIEINANSASDNPLWVPDDMVTENETAWQWVSGGNFLAMHMAESMDALRKIMTRIVKLNDRHLSRMINPHENNGLPANLSDKNGITQCSFKGLQIQSGMFEVYSSLLSVPVTTFFGVHEENNQDITSHALTSGILGLENIRLVKYSLAQNLLAVAQAVDLRGGADRLSTRTQPIYHFIRSKSEYVREERPLHTDIESIYQSIDDGELISLIRENVFHEYASK